MNDYGVEELVLLALVDDAITDGTASPEGVTTSVLGDALGLSETMADRLTLLSAVSTLAGNELVDETTDGVDDRTGKRCVYRLTAEGRRRARELREGLADERVTVHDGDEAVECRLGDVPAEFGLSMPEAVVRRSPDGDLSLEATTDGAFVGRADELGRLEETLEDVLNGTPRTAVVTGDAGVGKTTLVEAFADRARDRGVDVLVGRSRREGEEPYGPLREAIEGALGESADLPFDDERAAADDAEMYRAQLAALYYQTAALLADTARETPTVLVVEDLQWADAATVDLFGHLATEVADAPLLLVATYRPSGVDDEHPLGPRLDDRPAAERLVELELAPFDREATAALVEAELGRRGVPDDFVDAIHEGTGGNALFIVETVAQLLEAGTLDPRVDRYPDAIDEIEIPDVVGTTIERRFARLDEETRRVLEVGAVLGDPMSVEALVAIPALSEARIRERIDLLVDGGVWRRDGERVRFTSEVLRSTALETIDEERRRELHREVAAHLADAEPDRPAIVASHYGRAGETERALEYYRRAAEEATGVYAHDVAVDHYERALSLARDLDRDEAVLDLLEALGDIHVTRGEHEAANKQFQYVRERADDPERIRRSYRYQAKMAFESSTYDEAEAYARRGLEVDGDEVTEEVCWLTDYLGSAYFGRGRYEESIEHHERLRERAAEIDFTLALGRAHQNLGDCYGNLGELERAVELVERGVELLESAGDERQLASGLNDLAVTYERVGNHEGAVEALERCHELAERTGNVPAICLAKSNLAVFAQQRGEWETARELYAEVRELTERIEDKHTRSRTVWNESMIEKEIGSLDDAIDGFETALALGRDTEANRSIAHYEWGLGASHYLLADFERAEDYIDRALEIATEHGFTRTIGACKSIRGAIERERGETERAIELQREALELVSELDDELVRLLRAERLARTLIRAGEVDEGLAMARDAHEGMPDGNPSQAVKIDATYGAAQLAAGDREAARETLESTLERARDLSNEAVVIALRELGRLASLEGDAELAHERLSEGRRVAEEAALRVFLPHFDELLADLDGAPSTPPADARADED